MIKSYSSLNHVVCLSIGQLPTKLRLQCHSLFQATLSSAHLLLRRAAVACLRQLVTREAKEVSDQALTLAVDSNKPDPSYMARPESNITETGLEGVLYGMMDTEIDGKLISDIEDTLVSLLQSLATKNLTRWLLLLKDVLSASTGKCYTVINFLCPRIERLGACCFCPVCLFVCLLSLTFAITFEL